MRSFAHYRTFLENIGKVQSTEFSYPIRTTLPFAPAKVMTGARKPGQKRADERRASREEDNFIPNDDGRREQGTSSVTIVEQP